MKKQSRKQSETEKFVDVFIEMNAGNKPTYKDIQDKFNISYTSAYVRCKHFREKMSQNTLFGNETAIDKYIRNFAILHQ